MLKRRFLCLKNLQQICQPVISICCIHIFCINENGEEELDFVLEPEQEVNNFVCHSSCSKDVGRKGKKIATTLNNVLRDYT